MGAASGDTVSITVSGTIALTTGEIAIANKNLVIAGPGANSLTITTNAATRALKIVNAQCTISGLTFNNCKGLPGDVDTGGAIAVDNFTSGGVANVTTINDGAFTSNQSGWGGAVDVFSGELDQRQLHRQLSHCGKIEKLPARQQISLVFTEMPAWLALCLGRLFAIAL